MFMILQEQIHIQTEIIINTNIYIQNYTANYKKQKKVKILKGKFGKYVKQEGQKEILKEKNSQTYSSTKSLL